MDVSEESPTPEQPVDELASLRDEVTRLRKSHTKISHGILEPLVTLHVAQNLRPVAYELKLSNWKMTFVDGNETSSGSATAS